MKRVLLLGGAMQQIPSILKAKELGYYTITCDYLPNNPGHKLADEYYNVSTTNQESVLKLAKNLNIDGIVAYASDPAAPTAAYVAEQLGLPGNPYESVKILTQKDLFREFLSLHGFTTPKAKGFDSYDEAEKVIDSFKFPVMVKPVDSSGSKGVVKIFERAELETAVKEALSYSMKKRFIIEEFIEKKGYQVSGDGFSVDGELVFTSYGNELYSDKGTREYVALGEFWPSELSAEQKAKVDTELQRLITALGMRTSAYNIEVILDKDDNVYILELGPRNGGSYIPQLIQYATGIDMIEYTLKAAVGEDCSGLHMTETKGFWSNYMILSTVSGVFKELSFDEQFRTNNLLEVHCTYNPGDIVTAYQNTSHSLGTILFKANSLKEMLKLINNIEECYKVVVDDFPTEIKSNLRGKEKHILMVPLYSSAQKEYAMRMCDAAFVRSVLKREDYLSLFQKVDFRADFCAAYTDDVIGYAAMYANDLQSKTAYITLIAVRRENQKAGVGSALIAWCESTAIGRGMRQLRLEVAKDNTNARSFYERHGFCYEAGQKEGSLYMRKSLEAIGEKECSDFSMRREQQ